MYAPPNFFIVGTPKGGTTSLFNYLEQHPEIFVPEVKEPHYFSMPEVTKTYYKTQFITNEGDYKNLYAEAEGFKAIGDFSSSYLYHSDSAKKIKQFNPEAKIIVVLRNPWERSLSHYLMDYTQGYISVPLAKVLDSPEEFPAYYQQYVSVSAYADQLRAYYEVFPKEHLLIVLSEDLFQHTQQELEKIFSFLGVEKSFVPKAEKAHNQYKQPRFAFVGKLKQSKALQAILKRTPEGLKGFMGKILFDASKSKPDLLEERARLKKLLLPSVKATEKHIHKDLSHWE